MLGAFRGANPGVVWIIVPQESPVSTRIIGYIDGFNLYYGLRERKWKQYYWIDPYRLIHSLLAPEHQLVGVKYFTARVRGPDDKRDRQSRFLDALGAVSQAEVIHG